MDQVDLLRLVPEVTPEALDILRASRGPIETPIRSEIFGPERFAQHGRSLGDTHRVNPDAARSAAFFPRLQDNIRVLREAQHFIAARAKTGYDVSPAAEWLLDNFHLIEGQVKEIHDGLPRRYFRDLPVLLDPPLAGLPRIYGVAWAFVAHTDGAFDEKLLARFLAAYQQTRELTLGELWALPTTLRVVLVENLRRLAERVATNKASREVANCCCDRIETFGLPALDSVLTLIRQRGVDQTFLAQMGQRLRDYQTTGPTRYLDWLGQAAPSLGAIQTQQPADQAADNLSVGNAIGSLRLIGNADWQEIISETSATLRLLLTSPAFAAEREDTRDQTLHAIELLARRSGRSEHAVAQTLLDLMHSADSSSAAESVNPGPELREPSEFPERSQSLKRPGLPVASDEPDSSRTSSSQANFRPAPQAVASYWLRGPGRPDLVGLLGLNENAAVLKREVLRRVALPVYLGFLAIFTTALVAWVLVRHSAALPSANAPLWLTLLTAALMLFPAAEAVVAVINRLISESARPRRLPRLALAHGIPPEHRVMVVIPGMLTSEEAVDELAYRLELHYLANPEQHAQFALLTDWADAAMPTAPGDKGLLDLAVRRIVELNERCAGMPGRAPRFIVLHRERKFCESEQRWIGWERKRGKLEQLIDALADPAGAANASAFIDLGEWSRREPATQYVVTLDGDTQLPPGRLRDLVGIAAHPHNQPQVDAARRVVVAGYGILQPRVVTPLPTPKDMTLFHWLFAGQCGIDPYSAASSEVYQDLFGEGTFTGKGLLNVRAMHAVLSGRLPDGQVLSHDLLEGSLARCAAVTDITVIEDAPFHADVAASRMHRWTRGDWQLLPFVLRPAAFGIRGINRWKMIDNLRRSLVAPMSLGLLLLALGSDAVSPWAALALVAAAYVAGPLMGAVAAFAPTRDEVAKLHFYRQAVADLARAGCSGIWFIAQLLSQAMMSLDAVGRSIYRQHVSRRHLLEWTTAAAAQAAASTRLGDVARKHRAVPLVALMLAVGLLAIGPSSVGLTLLLCAVWAASPVWTWWVSRTRLASRDVSLPAQDQAYLEGMARDTWRLFERCVGPEDNHLPPDNLQVTPITMVAHRTSPTNIGLYLLSVACARHFGWIDTENLISRFEATLKTLHELPRHRGHFLNWYDTQSKAALLPMYVSTVDSGNLSGHLLAAAQACRELARAPYDSAPAKRALAASLIRIEPLRAAALTGRSDGALDRVLALADPLAECRDQPERMDELLRSATHELADLTPAEEMPPANSAAHQFGWRAADHLATLRGALTNARAEARAACGTDLSETGDPGSNRRDAAHRLLAIANTCDQLAWEADFRFLYHLKRQLFHIGFRVAEQQLDASFYDLIASESRLTSLLAIAKGDVPVKHWASLGRPFYAVGSLAGLRSWSGSMFEYMMPSVVLEEPYGSVLSDANCAALHEQIRFARGHHVPWGISESAYAASDHTLAYQYSPQGVPRLALRRTPTDELVIAPYATALGALVAPHLAVANFYQLEAMGSRGQFGFIEALDFTPSRQSASEGVTHVNTYMAHHQGMTIVAMANVLLQGTPRRWCMANAHIAAVASLLHERAPREISVLHAPPPSATPTARDRRQPGLLREVAPGMTAVTPTHLLSNGRYSVALRANGAGWSRWGQVAITRSRDDILRDSFGSFFHLRWDRQPAAVSLTQHPAPDPTAEYHSTYHADRVCFDAIWPELQSHVTVWVSPEDDIEFRQVELLNLTDRPIDLELMSAFQITLADTRADEAHPAFSNLFLRAHWRAPHQALVFERKARLGTELGLFAAHFLANIDPQISRVRVQTNRARWLGRNRDASQPLAQFDAPPLADVKSEAAAPGAGALDTGLDPVCAMSVGILLAPGSKIRLTFCTAAADNIATLDAVIDKYRQSSTVKRSSLMSATLTGIRMRELRITPENFAAIQTLTTAMVMTVTRPSGSAPSMASLALVPSAPAAHSTAAPRPGSASLSGNPVCDRRLLWRFGISGDRPILLVSAGSSQGVGLLRSMVQALRVWSWGGVACDLVVINAEPASYVMELHRELATLRERYLSESGAQPGPMIGGFYVLRVEEISVDDLSTLHTLARLHLNADGRPLTHHLQELNELHEAAFEDRHATSSVVVPVNAGAGVDLRVPEGQFMPHGGDFRFDVNSFQRPKRPWVNIMANPNFGTQLSEGGGGYTWALNSRLNQVTPWSNDPLADPPGEWLLLQDVKSRTVWSVTPSAWGDPSATYRVSHGQGHSEISHRRGDLDVTVSWCVDPEKSVKQVRLRLVNRGHRTQQLRAIGIAEWVMGGARGDRASAQSALFTQRLPASTEFYASEVAQRKLVALLCTQRERSTGFGGGTAFLALAVPAEESADWTCDRRECFDARGRLAVPDHYGQRSGTNFDPCAALSTRLTLGAGELVECVFLIGFGATADDARQLAISAASVSAMYRLEHAQAAWNVLLDATTVVTPDPLFDALVNRWLIYQTVVCRLWAKAGFYQAGGAFGFRDQLQDAMALAWTAPKMLREQILLNASRQFAPGDVQHWWHAPTGAGVRTHFSDDLLWLPHACVHYLRSTGDRSLLDESVPFLEGTEIPAGAEDAYEVPSISAECATVFEHAARAIDRSLPVGVHGLPLMGTGDWNDGMNRVGHEGRGESVWLAWFLCDVVAGYAPIAHARGESDRARRWEEAATGWKQALQSQAWDGQWYKRAFFDDGTPLGSHINQECRIDLIAQAWAVISNAAPAPFQRMAMAALDNHLVDREAGLIRLLTPPLDKAEPSAGYIQAYPKGVRENGGQYSHAGVWALIAQAISGDGDAAYRYFKHLSPAHRSAHPDQSGAYEIEPYVMAGDIYSQVPYVGRGGWSWYTGSAAWMHRAAIEHQFGLRQGDDEISFKPCLPSEWDHAEITLRRDGRIARFIFCRPGAQVTLTNAERARSNPLTVGQVLRWTDLGPQSSHLLMLEAPAMSSGMTAVRPENIKAS